MLIAILIIFSIILFFYFSVIKIEIQNVQRDSRKIEQTKSYLIKINIYFLKIKWFSYKIDKSKMRKLKSYKLVSNILKNKIIKDYRSQVKLLWKNGNEIKKNIKLIQIEKLNLKIEISNKNPIVTSYKFAILSAKISKFLLKTVKKKNYKNVKYKILPIYNDENYSKIQVNCIVSVKIAHIIKVINKFVRRSGLKNGRTSNRRTHDDCYGQY